MHTKDFLAQELRAAGLDAMADKAAAGYYHDFLSPLRLPEMQLGHDLFAAGTPAAMALRKRHHDGEFDASVEESEEWLHGADGQATIRDLIAVLAVVVMTPWSVALFVIGREIWRAL